MSEQYDFDWAGLTRLKYEQGTQRSLITNTNSTPSNITEMTDAQERTPHVRRA